MTRGGAGGMLGVGGTRRTLSRTALRGGRRGGGQVGGGADPVAQKRALLRELRESREGRGSSGAS
ncbi:DUF6243 family protein [Streptomyces sp. NPDC049813]|uniref:DUF6243 family protein n=1 Tax=Streptomyces sp. NPDC049813 TaxID=3365597 RepID=UPI0037AEFD84